MDGMTDLVVADLATKSWRDVGRTTLRHGRHSANCVAVSSRSWTRPSTCRFLANQTRRSHPGHLCTIAHRPPTRISHLTATTMTMMTRHLCTETAQQRDISKHRHQPTST